MKQLFLSFLITLVWLVGIAQERTEYDGIAAIAEIKEGWLIVRLPGFEKKIAALDSLLAIAELSTKSQHRLVRELAMTVSQKEFIHKWYPLMFDSAYVFSKCAFIYTHETSAFLNGEIQARDADGNPVSIDEKFFFATLNGHVGGPLHFTTEDHQVIGYPFPNNIISRGRGITIDNVLISSVNVADALYDFIPLPLGMVVNLSHLLLYKPGKKHVYRHAKRVNKRLTVFFSRKYE